MRQSERGIGIVEVMVALTIFGFGIGMVLMAVPRNTDATARSRALTKAANLAQEKIEELQSLPQSATQLQDGTHQDPNNPLDRHFQRSWTVQSNTPVMGMNHIAVSVSFPASNQDSVITLSTLTTDRRR